MKDEIFSCLSWKSKRTSVPKLPKLLFKDNMDAFQKRDSEDALTSEDLDDWIEAFAWFLDVYKESQESIAKKDIKDR